MAFEGSDLFGERPTRGGGGDGEPPPPQPEATLIQGAADVGPEISGVKVESTIGTGGQGTVFLGRQEYLNRRVAVKVLHKATNPKLADRFRREATILAGLHHPNIVACYSAGVSESEECFMVMEFIDGPDLHDHVKDNGPIGLGLALDLVRDLADALAHGLEASVIHRDIKPQNVLLKSGSSQTGRGLQAKLTDLGLARFTDDKGEGFETTEQGAVLGTPTTMAPEQSDDPDSVDHRTDIYGLGCVLYWALTGERAFFAKSMAALYRMKTSGEGLKRIEEDPDLPNQVKPLLLAMLAAEPADRPQSYEELIEALDGIRSGVQPEIAPRKRSQAKEKPSRGLWWGAAAVGVAALAVTAWVLSRPDEPDRDLVAGVGEQQAAAQDPVVPNGPASGGVVGPTEESPGPAVAGAEAPALEEPKEQVASPQGTKPDPQPASEESKPEPEAAPAPRVVVLAEGLEAGETRALFDAEDFLGGWDGVNEDWIPQDGEGDLDDKTIVRALNMRGDRMMISRPAPAGDWTLAGDLMIGPMRSPSPWSASVELRTVEGEVLRLDLEYYKLGRDGSSDPVAESSLYWSGPDETNPLAGANEVSTQPANMREGNYLVRAEVSFRITPDGESVKAFVDGHGLRVLKPPAGAPTFEAVRLISDSGQGRWENLRFERPE